MKIIVYKENTIYHVITTYNVKRILVGHSWIRNVVCCTFTTTIEKKTTCGNVVYLV